MTKDNILITQIFGFLLLAILYYGFLFLYNGYAPHTNVFIYLALFLALFAFLVAASKTTLYKTASILFFLMTLYQLISYKIGWDTLEKIDREGCYKENEVLKDFNGPDIFTILKYQYSTEEGKCILRIPRATDKKNGARNGK